MPTNCESLQSGLNSLSTQQINQAGQRYTPGIDPTAPNLRIESLSTAIENVACGLRARTRFQSTLDEFSQAWELAESCSQHKAEIHGWIDDANSSLTELMTRLRAKDAGTEHEWLDRLSTVEVLLSADMDHWRAEETKRQSTERDYSYNPERAAIGSNINSIGRCLGILQDEKNYIQSPTFKVLFDPQLLVSGEWGTGKTHLLCDFTKNRISRGQPTALILAKNFQSKVVEKFCAHVGERITAEEVFNRLEDLARDTADRAIVILDGVNEGNRGEWRQAIATLRSLVVGRPNIGLIVSCRTPFECSAIEHNDMINFHKVTHIGFDDQEFDAQAEFFQYYNLSLPEVPLLDREFSRPLTLKLICQSLNSLEGKKLKKGFMGIASGQKGMTFVLESFVNLVGKPIEQNHNLQPMDCWKLLKGRDSIADGQVAGFAPCMAVKLRDYVRRSEADRIIAAHYPNLKPSKRRQFLETLRTNGLIEEDAIWYPTKFGHKFRIVFRLPYQRFSDHLVARHLLKMHLDVSSPTAIKKSFTGKSPLAKIFRLPNRYNQQYAQPGLAQALITEFPIRVGQRLPRPQRELLFVLPKRVRNMNAYFNPFIEGLFWREPAAFTEATGKVIDLYLNAGSQEWIQIVDTLTAISTKPKHPYHAKRLFNFLARYTMSDRDIQWSEYLRRQYESPTIRRLLTWAEKLDTANMTEQYAEELIVLLSLVLTTVVRSDRDLATKTLVLIGERFPKALFSHTVTSLEFNDPYVPERMLAAAYGATLSLADSPDASKFQPALADLAKSLYQEMFKSGGRHTTHHTLMRDYALGIIQIANSTNSFTLSETAKRNMAPPLPEIFSKFSSNGTPDQAISEAIGNAIRQDFGNYKIGSLISERANYDDNHPEYIKVRAKIEQRIHDLGYRAECFKETEIEIANRSWNASAEEKVDRYGKKYSWIAYFEMWGERDAESKLPHWLAGTRTPDCGVDPSFPKRPPDWRPPVPDLFDTSNVSTNSWVGGNSQPNWDPLLVVDEINDHAGDWVLAQGYIRGTDDTRNRKLTAFLRGVFVARKDLDHLRSKFLAEEYPGESKLPIGASEHYLYAGEAGRRANYISCLCQRNGRYRRQIVKAFDEYIDDQPRQMTLCAKTRQFSVVRVEIPYIRFDWKSYHSLYNEFSGFYLPAPSLIQRLGLARKNREINFYDSTDTPGTLYRESGSDWTGNRHSLLYYRADLLRRYLAETRQVLVWCNWGERDWLNKSEFYEKPNPERRRIYQAYDNIHRSFSQWSAKDSKIVKYAESCSVLKDSTT